MHRHTGTPAATFTVAALPPPTQQPYSQVSHSRKLTVLAVTDGPTLGGTRSSSEKVSWSTSRRILDYEVLFLGKLEAIEPSEVFNSTIVPQFKSNEGEGMEGVDRIFPLFYYFQLCIGSIKVYVYRPS